MITIEYGPTNDGAFLVKQGGEIIAEPGKAGPAKEAADKRVSELRAKGEQARAVRTFFRVSRPKTAAEPPPTGGSLVAALVELSIPKLTAELATGHHDHLLDELEAAERATATPRIGALDAIEARRGEE